MDTDYETVLSLIRTLQQRHVAAETALQRAATERQTLRDALANESRHCEARGAELEKLRERFAAAQVSERAVEELQRNYDEARDELARLRRLRATDEEWTRDDTIRKLRAQLANAQGVQMRFANLEELKRQVDTLRAENLRVQLGREADDQTIRQLRAEKDRWRTTAKARHEELVRLENLCAERSKELDNIRAEARRAWGARSALIGALGICGASWEPMTGDGPEAVRCTQVCSLASGHKGAHGWGKNVQATTVQASKDPA